MYTLFYYIKVGFKGVKIMQVCLHDVSLDTFSIAKDVKFLHADNKDSKDAQADFCLCRVHMSGGMLSHVVAKNSSADYKQKLTSD